MSSPFTLNVRGLIFLSPLEINTAICRFGWMAATCRTASVGPLNYRWHFLQLAVFSCKNLSSYNLWQCKCYRHKNRDLREINRDMHRMFAFTDLCIIWSYWCIITANEHFALLIKSAYINKYLLFNQFIK